MKQMRVSYYKEKDMFVIELLVDGEWCFSKGYKCQPSQEDNETNYIHYGMVKEINRLLNLGYIMVCNYNF